MWTQARLGGIGRLGDAVLAGSCVPAPGDTNPDRVICGGIYFDRTQTALSWPGAAMLTNVGTVNNTLPDTIFPVSMPMFDMGAGPAGTPAEAARTGQLAPATLVSPLPSITPVRPDTVTERDSSPLCALNQLASASPWVAGALCLGLFFLVRGGKR